MAIPIKRTQKMGGMMDTGEDGNGDWVSPEAN